MSTNAWPDRLPWTGRHALIIKQVNTVAGARPLLDRQRLIVTDRRNGARLVLHAICYLETRLYNR